MNLDASLARARQHINRSIGQRAMHARVQLSDSIRRAKWLAECEAAVAMGKLRYTPIEQEEMG